ncbi:MAG: hypothetical protein WB580_10280 [Candidatus Binataceae bacterium]
MAKPRSRLNGIAHVAAPAAIIALAISLKVGIATSARRGRNVWASRWISWRAVADHDVVRLDAMAPGQPGGEIARIGRWIARDKRGRVMVCGECLRRRPLRIEAGAEIRHAGRRRAAVSPVNPELHRSNFMVKYSSSVAFVRGSSFVSRNFLLTF